MAKQLVGIGSSANDGTGDTLRDGAIKFNSNFEEIYGRLGNDSDILVDIGPGITDGQVLKWSSTPTPAFRGGNFDTLTGDLDTNGNSIVSDGADHIIIHQTGTGDIKLWGGGSGSAYTYIDGDDGYLKWYAPYSLFADLPDASNHHGMFAHVHGTGKGYFAHNAGWTKLLDETDGISSLSDVDTTVNGGPADGQVLKWNATNSAWEPANDLTTTNGGGGDTPNLFETFTADTGSTTASAPNDTLNIVGGTNISTTLSGDTLTIDMTGALGDPDQNVFTTIGADNGSTTATVTTDTINFLGGNGISTNLNAGAITISADPSLTLPTGTEGQHLYYDGTQYTGAVSPTLFYSVTANNSSAYRFAGPGQDSSADNPTFYVYRGFTYQFKNTTGSNHPFEIRVADGGAAVTNGVSGSSTGTTTYTVPMSVAAGTTYFYQCTIHGTMIGNIVVV